MFESIPAAQQRLLPAIAGQRSGAGEDHACDQVIALVARHTGVPIRLMTHHLRCRAQTARARQIAMYLSHVVLGRSLASVGEAFGRDRTTVSYACHVIEDLRDDPKLDQELNQLQQRIEAELEAQHAC